MPKLPIKYRFLDLSDYGRSPGNWIASKLQYTKLNAIHVTTLFIITGFIAIGFLLNGYLIASAFFIILKSILDASDVIQPAGFLKIPNQKLSKAKVSPE